VVVSLLCFDWEAVQQRTPTQPKVSVNSNRTEQHVNALLAKHLQQRALLEEVKSVRSQVVVLEGCGIDVFRTATEHGLPIKVVIDRSQDKDTYGLILVE
jgi:hypothetical protein